MKVSASLVRMSRSVCTRRRLQGVIARWSRTSRMSATIASAIASTPAAMISVLKPLWIASKIGTPSPSAPR